MKTKLILFDFDGTLVNSKAILIKLYNEVALQKGYKLLTKDNIEYLHSITIKERCKYLGIPLYKIPFVVNRLIKDLYSSIASLEFQEGVKEVLYNLVENDYSFCFYGFLWNPFVFHVFVLVSLYFSG